MAKAKKKSKRRTPPRDPKTGWFKRCVRAVKKRKGVRSALAVCGGVKKRKARKARNPRPVRVVVQLTRREFAAWQNVPAVRLRILAYARKYAHQHGGAASIRAPGGHPLTTVG